MTDDLVRLAAGLPERPLTDSGALVDAGQRLRIDWPADYIALISRHNGVEGDVGEFGLVLTAVEELVTTNDADFADMFPGLVLIGGDGAGEALAIHRKTGQILLVPWIGDADDWLLLGDTITDAFRTLANGGAFTAPRPFGSNDIAER
jgi:hypothetical protein